jgi:DNA gyrase subunit B
MREVIEKGYLYIAQPPLYRAKKGAKERYLKNEAELSEYLLTAGLDGITIKAEGKVVPQSQVLSGLKSASRFTKAIERVAKKLHPDVLRALVINGVTAATLENEAKFTELLAKISKEIRANDVEFEYSIEKDPEHNAWFAKVQNVVHGSRRFAPINVATLDSPEYEELIKFYQSMLSLGAGPFVIATDKTETPVANGEELAARIVEIAKNGMNVQRYKGLGEMNPEQLWETTMDPARRTLLQVSVDDAVEADGIFSVLMGDAVEPRRQFIEENALRVRNLDV